MEQFETISPKDLELIHLVDTSDEVIEILDTFYREYNLSPNF
jgi:predicted Rossmann-fold nucleotide-binding protein